MIISKDRAHKLYKEVYLKCLYWLEKCLTMASKKVIWKLLATKNLRVSDLLEPVEPRDSTINDPPRPKDASSFLSFIYTSLGAD